MQNKIYKAVSICLLTISFSGCVGKLVETAVDTTIAVAKVPFKVAGAAVDVVSSSDNDKEDHDHSDGKDHGHTHDN